MRLIVVCSVLLLLAGQAQAKSQTLGLGIVFGEPTGLSGKLFVDQRHAFQLGLDFSFRHDAIYVGLDYLRHFPGAIRVRGGSVLVPYIGIGGKISVHERHRNRDAGRLAVRVPLGLAWMPSAVPIDVFAEIVPQLHLVPDLDPGVALGIGIRYFF